MSGLTKNCKHQCAYCGIPATDVEHVIPKSFIQDRMLSTDKDYHKMILVHSCNECNILASNKVFKNFHEKRRFIREKVKDRYRDLLLAPDWSDKEINELTGWLKKHTFYWQKLKLLVERRIENLSNNTDPEYIQ